MLTTDLFPLSECICILLGLAIQQAEIPMTQIEDTINIVNSANAQINLRPVMRTNYTTSCQVGVMCFYDIALCSLHL